MLSKLSSESFEWFVRLIKQLYLLLVLLLFAILLLELQQVDLKVHCNFQLNAATTITIIIV